MRQDLENYLMELDKFISHYDQEAHVARNERQFVSAAVAQEAVLQLKLVKMKIQTILLKDLQHGTTNRKSR